MIYIISISLSFLPITFVAFVLISLAIEERRYRRCKRVLKRYGNLPTKIMQSQLSHEQKRALMDFYLRLLAEEIPRGRKLTVWLNRYESYVDATEHQIERTNALVELN